MGASTGHFVTLAANEFLAEFLAFLILRCTCCISVIGDLHEVSNQTGQLPRYLIITLFQLHFFQWKMVQNTQTINPTFKAILKIIEKNPNVLSIPDIDSMLQQPINVTVVSETKVAFLKIDTSRHEFIYCFYVSSEFSR